MSAPPDSAADTGFSPRVVLGLVMAAVLAAGAFALLSAYAPELRNPQGEGPNALSPGATGYMGAVRLMRLMGQTIVVNRDPSALSRYDGPDGADAEPAPQDRSADQARPPDRYAQMANGP